MPSLARVRISATRSVIFSVLSVASIGIVMTAVVSSFDSVAGGTNALPITSTLVNSVNFSLAPPTGMRVAWSGVPAIQVFCSSVNALSAA